MGALLKRLRAGHRREDGQVIIMVGLATIVMFAVVGLAVDVGRMYIMKAQLSRALDAAALAGVLELPNQNGARAVCNAYLAANEPRAVPVTGNEFCTIPGENELMVEGRKHIETLFIRVLGVKDASVKAKARAGFGVASVDAVLVLDTTLSMQGAPLTNAKLAAINFKNTLLGNNPDGRTVIGLTAFGGCYRPIPLNKPDCVDTASGSNLTSNSGLLTTKINGLTIPGGGQSATNVCTGLAKGWSIIDGPGNHTDEENSRRYLVLLSDGDNYYKGDYTYQRPTSSSPLIGTAPNYSPDGVTINGTDYPCMPYDSCSSPWNTSPATPCNNGLHAPLETVASDNFGNSSSGSITENFPSSNCTSYNWNGSGGWSGSWSRSPTSGTDRPVTVTSPAQGTSCAAQLQGASSITRTVNLSSASSAGITYYARRGSSGWESSDFAYLEAATNSSGPWTNIVTHNSSLGTSYASFGNSTNLNAFAGQSTVYIRFRSATTTGQSEYFYVDTINISTVTSCPDWNNTTSGSWGGNWTRSPASGNDVPALVSTDSPYDTTCHVRLRGVGAITRTVNLSGSMAAEMTFYAKKANWESSDSVVVEASTNGSTWTNLQTLSNSVATTSYASYTVNLDDFAGQSTVYLRFRGAMSANDTSDQFYLDAITVRTGNAGNANGYLNGDDGQSPTTCNENPRPRERQLDVRTLNIARAIKAQGVEIFVVAFTPDSITGCNLGSSVIYNDLDPAECNTVLDTPAGPIGNNNSDTVGNVRLLKCIASSADETADHYYYASSAAQLPAIFSQIAAKIAHRLLE